MQQEVTIVLPLTDNEGQSLAVEVDAIEASIAELTGGITISPVSGTWIDGGRAYHDHSHQVVTVVEGDKVGTLREYTLRAKTILRQQAMFFQVRPVTVEFL